MNIPIEFILGSVSVVVAICGYFFRSHDSRIGDNAEDINGLRLEISGIKSTVDESKRIRASDMLTLHELSKKMGELMEKIHELSLQLKDKQDRP